MVDGVVTLRLWPVHDDYSNTLDPIWLMTWLRLVDSLWPGRMGSRKLLLLQIMMGIPTGTRTAQHLRETCAATTRVSFTRVYVSIPIIAFTNL